MMKILILEGDNNNSNAISPIAQANLYYDRAKHLYLHGNGSSSELERVLRDLYRASSHIPNETKHYIFIAMVFKRLGDYHSMMSSLLYVLKLDANHILAKRLLYDGYIRRGQEYMCWAAEEHGLNKEHSIKLWKKALACFDFAIAIKHDESRLWLHHAICCIHLKENTKALASVNHCISISNTSSSSSMISSTASSMIPDDQIDVMTLRAKLYWALGLVDIGNKEIRQVAVHAPDHMEVLAYTARCYHTAENYYKFAIREFGMENYVDALHYANVAIKITEDDIKLYILISKIYRMMERLDDAYVAITKAKLAYHHQSHNDASSSHYQRQLEKQHHATQQDNNVTINLLVPKSTLLLDDKVNDNNTSSSVTTSSSSSSSSMIPDEIIKQMNLIFNDLAIQYASKGDYDRAIALFTKVIQSSIDLCKRYKSYNDHKISSSSRPASPSHHHSDDEVDCHKYLTDYKYYVNRGDCYRALNQLQDAYKDYIIALKIHPGDWMIRTKMSIIHYHHSIDYFNESKFLFADQEMTKAIELNPKISEYYATRGRIRYYFSDYIGAANDYKKCLELDPTMIDVAMRLEQFEAGGSHSVKQIEQKLPHHIIKLINIRNTYTKKMKIDAMRERLHSQGLFFHNIEDENENHDTSSHHHKSIKHKKEKKILSSTPSGRARRQSRLPPLPHQQQHNLINKSSSSQPMLSTTNIDVSYLPVLLVSEDYKIKKKLAEIQFSRKLDTTKSTLWPLLNNAKKLAMDKQELQDDISYDQHHLPSNFLALKKLSKEKAVNMSIAKGISSKGEDENRAVMKKFIQFKSSTYRRTIMRRNSSIQSRVSVSKSDADSMNQDDYDDLNMILNLESKQNSIIFDQNSLSHDVINEDDEGKYDDGDVLDEDQNVDDSLDDKPSKLNRRRRSLRNRVYDKNNDGDDINGNNEEDDISSSLEQLFKPIGTSKLVDFLTNSGINHEWKLADCDALIDNDHQPQSTLLVSEDEELRRGYQKAALDLESMFINKQFETLKKEKILKEQQQTIHDPLDSFF